MVQVDRNARRAAGRRRCRKSATVIPAVSMPDSSMSTDVGRTVSTDGSITYATAHGSWTGGSVEPLPLLVRPAEELQQLQHELRRRGADRGDPSAHLGVASAWCVSSSPTIVTGQLSLNTMCAASGSMMMLNSATAPSCHVVAAAHQDDLAHPLGQPRLLADGHGDVGQRADRDEGDGAAAGAPSPCR